MNVDYGWYDNLIKNAFHSRWNRPTGANAGSRKIIVRTTVTIAPDGRIQSARIVRPSGIRAVDQSVDQALRSVSRIAAIPRGLTDGGSLEVDLLFELD